MPTLFDFLNESARKLRNYTPQVGSPVYEALKYLAPMQRSAKDIASFAGVGETPEGLKRRQNFKKLSIAQMSPEDLALSLSPVGYAKVGPAVKPAVAALKAIDRTRLYGKSLDIPSSILQKLQSTVPGIKQAAQKELEDYLNLLQTKKSKTGSLKQAGDVTQLPRQTQQFPERLLDRLEQTENMRLPKNLSIPQPLENRISDSITDVKKKVNLLDYLRTPDRVLEKIGMKLEADLLRQKYDDYLVALPKEIDKISAWAKQVPKDANQRIFKWLDGKAGDNILSTQELGVAKEIKTYLKDWAGKLKLPEDKQISDYVTHLFPRGEVEKEFPEELAKLIHGKVVKSVYDPFLQRRVNKPEYLEDTWQALTAYTKTATRKYHMDQALEQVVKKADSLPLESFNYVKGRIARINMQPTDIDNLLDNLVKSSPIGYKFGQRPTAVITRGARQAVFRGLLGLNPLSALRNVQQSTNTHAVLGERYFFTGVIKTLQNLPRYMAGADNELERAGVLGKDIVQDKTLSAVKKFWEKADQTLFYQFNLAEKINRSIAYFGAKSQAINKGLSEIEAIDYAKSIVRKTQFNYDVIDTPAVLQSDIAKTLFQFGKYPLAQTEFLLEMIKDKNIAGSLRWLGSNILFIGTVGKVLGLAPKDMFPQFRFQTPPTLQLPVETGKALLGAPDEYGNVPEGNPLERVLQSKDVRRGLINYIPAGGQVRKSSEALMNLLRGGSYTDTNKLRYPAPTTGAGALQSLLFGPSSTKEARSYYSQDRRPLSETQTRQVEAGADYEIIQLRRQIETLQTKIKAIQKDDNLSDSGRAAKIQRLERKIERKQIELDQYGQ